MPFLYLHPHLNLVRAFLCVSVASVHTFVTYGSVCCMVTFCFLICLDLWPVSCPRGGLCPQAIDGGIWHTVEEGRHVLSERLSESYSAFYL